MTTINDGGPAFAVWESNMINRYNYGRIIKRNKASIVVQPWWDGQEMALADPRLKRTGVVFEGDHDAALALVKALNDLAARETQTQRQYAEKRKALIAAARAKGTEA